MIGRRGWGNDRGAAAVEFALILPILVLILFGVIEFGGAYNAQLMVTGAAREGAREMAVGGSPVDATAAAVDAVAVAGANELDVTVTPQACAAGADVTVTVVYDRPFLTGLFGATLELTGIATRRCQG